MKKHHFFTEDNVAFELTFRKLATRIWPFLWMHKKKVYISLSLILAFVVVGRVIPFLFGYVVDTGIRKGDLSVIGWLAIAYGAFEILRAGLAFVQSRYVQTLGHQVLYEIRDQLLRHVQRLPLTYFEKNPSGRTVTRVTNDVYALGELFSQGIANIFVNLIEMVSIFIALAFISVQMTALNLLVLPPLFWICFVISRRIRIQFGATKRKLSMMNAFTAESMSGIKLLQLFDKDGETREYFDHISLEYRDLQLSTIRLFATLWPVIEAFNLFTLAGALLLGSYFHLHFGLSLGQLSAYVILLQSFFKPLKGILERYNQLQNSLASADRVFDLLGEPEEDTKGEAMPNKLRGEIRFEDVRFRYNEAAPLALNKISFHIQPGTSVALVGRTGSGKTSIISLLQKFYTHYTGQISIDGQDLRQVAIQKLRPRIGVVQQDGFLFSGSVLNNITLFDESISREAALRATEMAQCQDLLSRHGGIDGHVLERGANFSAGEKQLLAFARVLAFDPDILILDEATANIDSVSEAAIQAATEVITKDRTSIIIAHRLSTILKCDQIIVLDQGQIVEAGSHIELLKAGGAYSQLYHRQFESATQSSTLVSANDSAVPQI